MILRIYIFSKLFFISTNALSFVSHQFCAKQKRIDIQIFSMLVLVNISYMPITFCFIVSMNRQIGNIQISSMQPCHNLTIVIALYKYMLINCLSRNVYFQAN